MGKRKKTRLSREECYSIYIETFELIYLLSNPPASFKVLMETSPKDKNNRIDISFENYEINEFLMDFIIDSQIEKYNLGVSLSQELRRSILLGPSPMSAKEKKRGN